ncbi:hypothetical protein FOA52_010048 [Chlamydomonas sp. UWO 241]|nr:hypothetical protein FOA52_010048 [Chlamydomonas sp. UWO 241]
MDATLRLRLVLVVAACVLAGPTVVDAWSEPAQRGTARRLTGSAPSPVPPGPSCVPGQQQQPCDLYPAPVAPPTLVSFSNPAVIGIIVGCSIMLSLVLLCTLRCLILRSHTREAEEQAAQTLVALVAISGGGGGSVNRGGGMHGGGGMGGIGGFGFVGVSGSHRGPARAGSYGSGHTAGVPLSVFSQFPVRKFASGELHHEDDKAAAAAHIVVEVQQEDEASSSMEPSEAPMRDEAAASTPGGAAGCGVSEADAGGGAMGVPQGQQQQQQQRQQQQQQRQRQRQQQQQQRPHHECVLASLVAHLWGSVASSDRQAAQASSGANSASGGAATAAATATAATTAATAAAEAAAAAAGAAAGAAAVAAAAGAGGGFGSGRGRLLPPLAISARTRRLWRVGDPLARGMGGADAQRAGGEAGLGLDSSLGAASHQGPAATTTAVCDPGPVTGDRGSRGGCSSGGGGDASSSEVSSGSSNVQVNLIHAASRALAEQAQAQAATCCKHADTDTQAQDQAQADGCSGCYATVCGGQHATEAPACAVCLAEFRAGDTLCTLPCGHEFHVGCIAAWTGTHVTCPLCRRTLHKPGGRTDRDPHHTPAPPAV